MFMFELVRRVIEERPPLPLPQPPCSHLTIFSTKATLRSSRSFVLGLLLFPRENLPLLSSFTWCQKCRDEPDATCTCC